MGLISLDHQAPWQDIAHAIKAAQRRCRTGLIKDELKVAKSVAAQVLRLQAVAKVLDVDFEDLWPSGVWTDAPQNDGPVTFVRISKWGLTVERGPLSAATGRLAIVVPAVQS